MPGGNPVLFLSLKIQKLMLIQPILDRPSTRLHKKKIKREMNTLLILKLQLHISKEYHATSIKIKTRHQHTRLGA